jgi:hypothetical protein
MPTIGQAQLSGGDIIIHCDDNWTCCQREQAAAKVRAMNRELEATPQKYIKKVVKQVTNDKKEACQSLAKDAFDAATPKERAKAARDAGAAPCLVEQIENGATRESKDLEMDHPLDVKLGGKADGVALIPLEGVINGFFGSVAQHAGNELRRQGHTKVESISLVCPAGGKCKKENHNAGPKRKYPDNPDWVTPKRAIA